MGLIEFIILCIITVGLAWCGVWALGYFLPGHPAIIDTIIWGLAVLIIVVNLLRATGLLHYDPQIPHIGS